MIRFIERIIKGQRSNYLQMVIILTLLSCFEFLLLFILVNLKNDNDIVIFYFKMLLMMMIAISFVLVLYLNNFFIAKKSDEFSIILLSGRNLQEVCQYLLVQFGPLFIICGFLGLILALLLTNFITRIFGDMHDFSFTKSLFYYYGLLLVLKLFYVLLLDFGKFSQIKFKIVLYLNHQEIKKSRVNYFNSLLVDKEEKRFPTFNLIVSCLSGLIFVTSLSKLLILSNITNRLFYFLFAIAALFLLIKYSLPLIFDLLHDHLLLKLYQILFVLNQLEQMFALLTPLILINWFLTTALTFLIMQLSDCQSLNQTIIISFSGILIIMIICFVYRISLIKDKQVKTMAILKAIGYQSSTIKMINYCEIIIFTIIVLFLPLLIDFLTINQGIRNYLVNSDLVDFFIISQLIAYLIICLYQIIVRRKLIMEVIKNVKYLNRGQ